MLPFKTTATLGLQPLHCRSLSIHPFPPEMFWRFRHASPACHNRGAPMHRTHLQYLQWTEEQVLGYFPHFQLCPSRCHSEASEVPSTSQSPTDSCRTHRIPEDSPGFLRIPQDSSGLLYHFGDFELVETNTDKSPGFLRTGTEFLLN